MPQTGAGNSTRDIIASLLAISSCDLPADSTETAKDLILDHLGCSLYGSTFEWCRILRSSVEFEGGTGESSIYGGRRTTARNAALVNGTAGHAIELDDVHDESLSHPGCVVIPAAFAVAEANETTGADFLTAIVVGYEAQARIGINFGSHLLRRGFHPTAQLGVFGAAAASGKLLNLSTDKMDCAFGLAASMASGIMKFTQDPSRTMVKRLHGGLPAERGVLAANLAAAGFTGPSGALEGPYGYGATYADIGEFPKAEGREKLEISKVSVKQYPCCRLFHSVIDAILKCRADPRCVVEAVETIEVFGPASMIEGHMERRPDSPMAAQYSLPFAVAVAMIEDPANVISFGMETAKRSDILQLVDRVVPKAAPDLEAEYPRKFAGRARLRMRSGQMLESTVMDSKGTPANPVSRSDAEGKFRSLTSGILTTSCQGQIIESVRSIDKAPSVARLADLLRKT